MFFFFNQKRTTFLRQLPVWLIKYFPGSKMVNLMKSDLKNCLSIFTSKDIILGLHLLLLKIKIRLVQVKIKNSKKRLVKTGTQFFKLLFLTYVGSFGKICCGQNPHKNISSVQYSLVSFIFAPPHDQNTEKYLKVVELSKMESEKRRSNKTS